jgi:hypothetical protein
VQREIEAAGFTTISLSNIPDLTAAVSVPRIAAIEHPFGLPFGPPGDRGLQTAVLRSTLQALQDAGEPGAVQHLPYSWSIPEDELQTNPSEPPPITTYLSRRPWLIRKLVKRDIPRVRDTRG